MIHLEDVSGRINSNLPYQKEYNKVLYSIVSVFIDDVKVLLSEYPSNDISSEYISEVTCNRIPVAMWDYFRFHKEFKKTYFMNVAFKKI